nr:zinc finger, CCHC-type [Tanacetum cinerariifolium]
MTGNTVKEMTTNFRKLDKFEGHDFRRWQKKMHFLLTTLKVVYVLTTPMPEFLEDATVEAIRLRAKEQDSDKGKGKEVGGPSINMIEEGGKNKHHKQNKGKNQSSENNSGSRSNKKPKLECWKCGKTGHFKRDCRSGKKNNANAGGSGKGLRTNPKTKIDAIAWWIDSSATTHVCKDRCWFKTYESVEDGFVLYMGDDHFAHVHGKGSVALKFSSRKTITLFNVLYVPKLPKNLVSGPMLNKCGYKQVYESDKYILSKSGVFVEFGYYNNGMFILNLNKVLDDSYSVYMSSSTVVNSSLWHARLGYVHYKRMLEMSKDDLIHGINENLEKCTTCMLTKITRKPFQSITRKSVILELIYSNLCDFHATPSLGNEKYDITFIDDASRFFYVYLLHAKDEALDKFRFYKTKVELQQNDLIKTLRIGRGGEYYDPVFFQSVRVIHETTSPYTPQQNSVAERKNRALKKIVNSMLSYSGLSEGFWGEAMLTACYLLNRVPNKKNKLPPMNFEAKDAIFDENRFFSIPISKDIIPNSDESQRDDHSNDVASEISEPRKEAIDDEISSIKQNNTWVLSDLTPGCKPLGCKWIFKRKMKVDGKIDKFKARLVIQGFKQKKGINYFDTYAPVARIAIIRLLLALAHIHNLVIHQMDVKTAFLNGDLDEKVYIKQPEGFIIPGNEHKVCKLVKSLYGLKQAPKQWHQKFDEVVLSSGFHLNQSDKCVSSKFDDSGKIKRENKGIVITQSHYIEKILKKFNREDFPLLEYSSAIGCLMYAMTSTRPDIAYVVGRLSRFTSNPSRKHWKAITMVFKYLRGTKDYGLSYVGYPSVLEGYSDASWTNHVEDSSSTSGWVFLLGRGAISWASKKQTCITGFTIESEFVALAAAGKEAEWLRNLIHEIPIWPKPIAPIFIQCDSSPTMARAYSQIYNEKSRHLDLQVMAKLKFTFLMVFFERKPPSPFKSLTHLSFELDKITESSKATRCSSYCSSIPPLTLWRKEETRGDWSLPATDISFTVSKANRRGNKPDKMQVQKLKGPPM